MFSFNWKYFHYATEQIGKFERWLITNWHYVWKFRGAYLKFKEHNMLKLSNVTWKKIKKFKKTKIYQNINISDKEEIDETTTFSWTYIHWFVMPQNVRPKHSILGPALRSRTATQLRQYWVKGFWLDAASSFQPHWLT